MLCTKCNKEFSDGLSVCPHCKEEFDYKRCPKCWTKLAADATDCHKCGCNIEKTLRQNEEIANFKEETAADKVKALPLWIKIAIPVLVVALCAGVFIQSMVSKDKVQTEAAELALEFVEEIDATQEQINFMATIYEKEVYAKDWLMHIDAAKELRRVYAQDIKRIKDDREPVKAMYKKIEALSAGEISSLTKDLYFAYNNCYSYVIGENGKYPSYLKNYKKILEEYDDIKDELVEEAKEILE